MGELIGEKWGENSLFNKFVFFENIGVEIDLMIDLIISLIISFGISLRIYFLRVNYSLVPEVGSA